jgi:formamidopyrimidine-DNA glycosylase
MPELPDVMVYVEALEKRIVGRTLEAIRVKSPFVLRTFDPPLDTGEGKLTRAVERLGKRIVLVLDDNLFIVIHLMIAGRFRWFDAADDDKPKGAGKIELASFTFDSGTLVLTEASPKKRASIHVVQGRATLQAMNPGGLEVLGSSLEDFAARLRSENHTLKRSLTSPQLYSGIGNAYSDEILHAAKLSPVKLTKSLTVADVATLHSATQSTLLHWHQQLRQDFGLHKGPGKFPGPGQITAFRPDFAVHGKFGQPCPVCGSTVRRIIYAENECNYCPGCQTKGKVLADRSLSRLLKEDWRREMEGED